MALSSPLLHVVLGADARRVQEEVQRTAHALAGTHGLSVRQAPPAVEWPWMWPRPAPRPPEVLTATDLHLAVDTAQTGSTRLVTTQAPFLLAEWMRVEQGGAPGVMVVGGHRATLEAHTPELVARRGAFGRAAVTCLEGQADDHWPELVRRPAMAEALRAATPEDRLPAAVTALSEGRTPPHLLATASVCQEVNDLESAARDLDEACALAPDWAAAWFERGKVWLRRDDMEAAARCFAHATRCLPDYPGAWGNLGAALGELDRTAEALEAFTRLLQLDPQNPQAHNNIGVVSRELGRLGESESAFRTVTTLDPARPYGYYNLGHTLFLQGRFRAAVSAYEAGQARDPDRNPVQGTRLGLALLAAGEPITAFQQVQSSSARLSGPYREQVLADTSAILWALISQQPGLSGWEPLQQWLQRQLPVRNA